MKITREQFKELYEIYENTLDLEHEYKDVFAEEFLLQFYEPIFNWITKQLGIRDEEGYFDLLTEYYFDKQYPIAWEEDEEGNCYNIEFTDDLDLIYDKYLQNN